jgi:hypothetical protein
MKRTTTNPENEMTEIKSSTFRHPNAIVSHTVGDPEKALEALGKTMADPKIHEISVLWPDSTRDHAYRARPGSEWKLSWQFWPPYPHNEM